MMIICNVSDMVRITGWNGLQSRSVPTASEKVARYLRGGVDQRLNSTLVKTWYKYFNDTFPAHLQFVYQLFVIDMIKDNYGYHLDYINIKTGEAGTVKISLNGLAAQSRLTMHQAVNNDLVDMLQDLHQAIKGTNLNI